jgi:hypothetical protein
VPKELAENLQAIRIHEQAERFAHSTNRIIAHTEGGLGDLKYVKNDCIVLVCESHDVVMTLGKAAQQLNCPVLFIGLNDFSYSAQPPGSGLFPIRHPKLAEHDLANYVAYLMNKCADKTACLLVHKDHAAISLLSRHKKALILNIRTQLEFSGQGKLCALFYIAGGIGSDHGFYELLNVSSQPIDIDNHLIIADMLMTFINRLRKLSGP